VSEDKDPAGRGIENTGFTAARMLAFAEQFAEGMSRECNSADHASLLYGGDGLPG